MTLALVLPGAFLVALGAALAARWADRVRARRLDIAYAQHRVMILGLREVVRRYEELEALRKRREDWQVLAAAANQFVTAFREAFAPMAQAADRLVRSMAEATKPPTAQPRDPRVTVVPRRRR